jgi:hypothetical protein
MTAEFVPWDAAHGEAPQPVSAAVIEQRLAERGVAAPPAYVAFVQAHGGQRFRAGTNEVTDAHGNPVGLGSIYHFDPEQPRYLIEDLWEQTAGELDPKLVPVMTTDFGGVVCLDYRAGDGEPSVVMHDFEAVPERQTVPIATSFSDLLRKLGLD